MKKSMTREEYIYRKRRIVHLVCIAVWVAFLIFVLLWKSHESDDEVVIPQMEEEEAIVVYSLPPITKESAKPVAAEEPDVGSDVEAVPMEASHIRDDIPLDDETQRLLWQVCDETGIRYELALAVIWQETDFRNITGDGGDSVGYMQVQPRWHKERMKRLGVSNLKDPYSNFLVGCDYLVELFGKYDVTDALTAYNSGSPGDSQYARDVLNYMNILTMEDF